MNKKTMVQMVFERMEEAEVVFEEGTQLRADDCFWERYPEGHCTPSFVYCVEEQLSCLDEQSLERILDLAPYGRGVDFRALWKAWGQAGVFKCDPKILALENSKVPVLRIRHDSYLHYMRGYAFQNSYDAYCNGSNGESNNLAQDIRAITWSEYAWDEEQEENAQRVAWEKEWALFRKAMIVQHSFVACGGRQTFYYMLEQHPQIFEDFINLTDSKVMHLDLDAGLTLSEMRKQCLDAPFDWRRGAFELALWHQDKFYGKLRFGETSVSFSWRRNGETHCSTIAFPEWDKQAYLYEVQDVSDSGIGDVMQLSQREYLRSCWNGLAVTLLSLEGISVSQGYCAPRKSWEFESTSVCLIDPSNYVHSLSDIWDKVDDAVRSYPGLKELRAALFGSQE